MSRFRKNFNKLLASFLLVAFVSFSNISFAADGEALFKANCANCHKPLEEYTGPALKGSKKKGPKPRMVS